MPNSPIQTTRECIDLLLIGGTRDDANQYMSALRGQGQPSQIDQIAGIDKLDVALQQKTAYKFLLLNDTANIQNICQAATNLQKQVPDACILLLGKTPEKHLGQILQTGIRDIVHPANSLHLGFAVLREQQVLQQRKILQSLRQQFNTTTQRLKKLENNTEDIARQAAAPVKQTLTPRNSQPNQADSPIHQTFDKHQCQLLYQLMLPQQTQTTVHYQVTWRLVQDAATAAMQIDHWLIGEAVQSLAQQHQQGHPMHLHIPLSDAVLQQPASTLTAIRQALQNSQQPGANLTLQLPEQSLRNTLESTRKLISGLRKLNCCVAVSEFKNRQGSQKMLDYLHIDKVNFAPGWTTRIREDDMQQNQLNALNQQLHRNSVMQTMVTGVKDAVSLALLWDMGFDYLSGDFIQPAQKQVTYPNFSN